MMAPVPDNAGGPSAAMEDRWAPMRAYIVAGALALVFGVIGVRAGQVSLAGVAEASGGDRAEAPRRADIVDRNGDLMATSLTAYSLFADPRAIWDAGDVAAGLATVFPDLDALDLEARLSNRERAFVWIRRGLTPRQRQAVFALGLEGLGFEEESRRVFPGGALAGHVLGHVNVDGRGAGGLELAYEDRLAAGGDPLELTLDLRVQHALEAELQFAADAYAPIGAAGVVVEAATGEIRAVASWPPVDPNRPGASGAEARLNRATGAVYELGSVFKPLTVAAGLDAGALTPSELFDVSTPLQIGAAMIRDDHPIDGAATLTDIIAHSSNIGTVKVAERLGERRLKSFYETLGLLSRPDVDLPGAARPLAPAEWDRLANATASFGHGLAVSPLSLAMSYTALANQGEAVAPRFVAPGPYEEVERRRVMAAPTAAFVMHMMRAVVTEGTGTRAEAYGYEIAGKTGTAEKPGPNGYDKDRNICSFAAVFPASRPEYVVLITLDEPKPLPGEGRTAGFNAAPVAGRLIARIAPLLDVEPVLAAPRSQPSGVRAVSDKRAL